MRKKEKITLLFLAAAGILLYACTQQKSASPEQEIGDTVLAQIDGFYHFVKDTFQPAVAEGKTPKRLQYYFLKTRLLYKKFEWASEYFTGTVAAQVNGPPVQEVEGADLLDPALALAINPSGLQVMEEYLFPEYDTARKKELIKQLDLLQSNCEIYKAYFSKYSLADWRILDAAKLEVFRILTLGITGYDNPLTLKSMSESAAALASVRNVLRHYTQEVKNTQLISQINAAITYLKQHPDFDTFDRAVFITDYGNKITADITGLVQQLNVPDIRYNRLLNQDAKTLFDSNAYNVNAFAPGREYFITKAKTALGEKLFFDASLSGTEMRSCASCHQPDKGFADGLAKNTDIHTGAPLPRNTPTLLNAALQSDYFYDMRTLTLEGQANDVIHNKAEMDGSVKEIVRYLRKDTTYRKLFESAFPQEEKTVIDSVNMLNAIASYVRSLTKLNSRFDEYMRGDSTALSSKEIKGFNLFMGKAKCATCHFMPLFNGITPPKYIVSEAEVIGVPLSLKDTVIDPDLGWYNIVGIKSYKHAFKTPTVRNISKTAPYMHNGIYDSLEQVMVFYNNGGGAGMGLKINNQSLAEDSLHLMDGEMADIIAFMKSLDSR